MPETFIYPEQNILIHNKFKNYKIDLKDLWLVKPSNKCSGQGIIILNSLDDISLKEYVLTKYITNVNLINGKKYDLRLYVLISGLKPLRIYFYKEGFARIAAEKYNLEERSIKNKFVHFTNIDVNINNKKFIMPNTTRDKNANIFYKHFLLFKNNQSYK